MNTKQLHKSQSVKDKEVRHIFKQMLSDKNTVRTYIREHGTLIGLKDESILFAKPL